MQIEIENLFKSYGNLEIVHGINLKINMGEFLVLVGPSGCGKSTTLRMIACLEEITGGKISIGGRIVNDVAPKDRNLAFVFQNYALYPHMSVYQNMAFALKLQKTPKNEIEGRIDEVSKILNLEKYLNRKPSALSGGQRQRVAMGRALVRQAPILLFDEPLSNLDAKLRTQMRAEIKKLHLRLKKTSVYVTHDQVEAMTLADRIVVMNNGNIEQIGKPMDLYHHPENVFVAEFIGSPPMNILTAQRTGSKIVLSDQNFIPLPNFLFSQVKDGEDIYMGIRPENFSLKNGDQSLKVKVNLIEPLGADTLIHGEINKKKIVAKLSGEHHFEIDSEVQLKYFRDSCHFFDFKTQKLIPGDSHAITH